MPRRWHGFSSIATTSLPVGTADADTGTAIDGRDSARSRTVAPRACSSSWEPAISSVIPAARTAEQMVHADASGRIHPHTWTHVGIRRRAGSRRVPCGALAAQKPLTSTDRCCYPPDPHRAAPRYRLPSMRSAYFPGTGLTAGHDGVPALRWSNCHRWSPIRRLVSGKRRTPSGEDRTRCKERRCSRPLM